MVKKLPSLSPISTQISKRPIGWEWRRRQRRDNLWHKSLLRRMHLISRKDKKRNLDWEKCKKEISIKNYSKETWKFFLLNRRTSLKRICCLMFTRKKITRPTSIEKEMIISRAWWKTSSWTPSSSLEKTKEIFLETKLRTIEKSILISKREPLIENRRSSKQNYS